MIVRSTLTFIAALSAVALMGCTEKHQVGGGIKPGAAPFNGTGSNFTEPGWKAGDKASWEQQLKTRQIYGQNEYTRTQ